MNNKTDGVKSGHQLFGTNLERAADHNQRVTLHAIRVNKSLTRIELSQITGLTAPAIANITKRLLDDNLILGAGRRHGGRGQPPTNFIINPDARASIGINIDRDHITFVIVNFVGETLARISREWAFALPDDVRAFWHESVEVLIANAGIARADIVGIGIASPDDLGLVDLPGRPSQYVEWQNADIAALFAEPLDLPVFVENDAAAAAMGELQLGQGQQYPSFFYILISFALGGGLVIDGTYFRGATGRSGELGFMGPFAKDGQQDQIQTRVSLSGLQHEFDSLGLAVLDERGDPAEHVKRETAAARWIVRSVQDLFEPLVAINCLINPAAILIGGRLPADYVDRLAAALQEKLHNTAARIPSHSPVLRATLAADAPAVGAAILPFSHFLLPKSSALWKIEK